SISVCAVLASVVSPQGVSARLEPEPRRARELHVPTAQEDRERVVFEGFVLTPDGGPAEGVMVLCSAGGKALTDAAGDYRLEVEVPLDATSVQVTAVGRAEENQVASTSVPLSHAARARPMNLGPLQLVRKSSCSPRWLPAFGGEPGTKLGEIDSMALYDDGAGLELYVGGNFASIGGVPAHGVAKWNRTP